MAVPVFTLHSWETRKYTVPVYTTADPTGATVEFGAVAITADDPDPATWTAGTWNGAYANGQAEAESPTFGTSESAVTPDVELTEGTDYRLMVRVRSSTDAPGGEIATVKVR